MGRGVQFGCLLAAPLSVAFAQSNGGYALAISGSERKFRWTNIEWCAARACRCRPCEGRNLVIERPLCDSHPERLSALATELVG